MPALVPANKIEQDLPHDRVSEQTVLSAMLLSPEVLTEALGELTEDEFFFPRNKTIFSALKGMFSEGKDVDVGLLFDYLNTHKLLDKAGGVEYLGQLRADTMALPKWRSHAQILRREATLRNMVVAAAQVTELALDAPPDTKEVVDAAERLILDVTNREINSNFLTMEEAARSMLEELEEQAANGLGAIGVQTGFPKIDATLLGLRKGQMVVVGARPSVGKTSFALNLAVQSAEAGASVAFFSLEMSAVEILQRIISSRSQVPLQRIRAGTIAQEDWSRILSACDDISKLDIMIDESPGTTVTEIRAKARRMLAKKKKGIVIIDYLQLIAPTNARSSDTKATEVAEISRGVKIMAKDLGVPVVTLSQLSRQSENRPGKRPQLSDLRDSGSIEQDADIVILLDRSVTQEEAARKDRPKDAETDFIIAKNRSGPVATIKMGFIKESTKFCEIEYGDYDEQRS